MGGDGRRNGRSVPPIISNCSSSMPDNHPTRGSCSCLATLMLYIAIVLIPQLFWAASYGTAGGHIHLSFCDGCLPLHPATTNPRWDDVRERSRNPIGANISAVDLCSCRADHGASSYERVTNEERSDPLGGWYMPHSLPDLTGPCSIKVVNSSLSQSDFLKTFAYTEPVILKGMSEQSLFRSHSTKSVLLRDYGQSLITIATANTHSYRKVQMTLCDYVTKVMRPQSLETLGNETLYHFGDNDREGWKHLFSLYKLPPFTLNGLKPVLSFGLAGPGTGVPFHIHGPTFAETIFGRKRWFLYPPKHHPRYNPDESTLHWLMHTFPTLQADEKPLECTLNPGDIIYFPNHWWHATLNLDAALFMSTFFG